jgi:hypothetical protein
VLVSKWNNGLAVRLPKALVDELGLKEGDELNVVAAKNGEIEVETKADQPPGARPLGRALLGAFGGLSFQSRRGQRTVSAFFDINILVYAQQAGRKADPAVDLFVYNGGRKCWSLNGATVLWFACPSNWWMH